jgi:hypothetical protein
MAAPYPNASDSDNFLTLVESDRLSSKRWDWTYPGNYWDKYYPYQLAILVAPTSKPEDDFSEIPPTYDYYVYKNLTFTLPYSPESMQTLMPFAISLAATQDGVVEQHGGVPFRQIVFSGTFGVFFQRPSVAPSTGIISGIAGGTLGSLNAAQGVLDAAKSLGGAAKEQTNLLTPQETSSTSTGYWQSLQLRRFLESYAELKKTAAGKSLRLALITWKERDAWLVTPMRYEVIRQAQSPFEYKYTLQFQAWKRVNPINIGSGATQSYSAFKSFTKFSPSLLNRVLNIIQATRKLVSKFISAVVAVRADVQKVMGVLRTVALLVKNVVGALKTLAELPAAILATFQTAVTDAWDILKTSFDGNVDPSVFNQVGNVNIEVNQVKSKSLASSPTLTKLLNDQSGAAFDFQSSLNVSSMNLSFAQQDAIEAEDQRVLNLSAHDLQNMRNDLLDFMASYADQIGLGNATYDQDMGHVPTAQVRTASLDDFRVLHALGSAATAMGYLIGNQTPPQTPTVIEYVAGLANSNGIEMRVPNSKFVVPFPYGGSLEKLAQQYLGDAGRWMEIAELNELRAPYVDEVGVIKPLVTNGKGNTVIVADSDQLLIGQPVWLYSITSLSEKRHIVNIQRTGTGPNVVLTLDGAADLAKLKTADHAALQHYQPGTVNCQQVIFIPSDRPSTPDALKYVPNGDDFARILDRGEIDGMLTESGDLVVTPDGDWPLVLGYANLVQWARIALNTKVGSMPLHPDFGLVAHVGDSNAESTTSDLLEEVKKTLTFNPSFTGVASASMDLNGPVLALGLELQVRGVDALLPITFDISLTNPGQ